MKNTILLIGAGGHCRVIIDTIQNRKSFKIAGIIDIKEKIGEKVCGVPVIGTDEDLHKIFKNGCKQCFISIGSVGNPGLRIKLYKKVKKIGFNLPLIVHPSAIVSESTKIGCGTFLGAGVIINSGTVVGENCIINTGAIIDHDCLIEDNVHMAPGTVLSGGVKIGECTHIGVGSSVLQYLKIGKRSLIGAGSIVTKEIPNDVVAYGNPCRIIRKNNE